MNEAKIRLSLKEMELVTNAGVILTKNAILEKSMQLLGGLQHKQQACFEAIAFTFPDEVINTSPKISKGENYKGLPYMVLDFPRLFEKEDVFAIRSMFWWGNFFSVTLHLSGRFKEQFEEKIVKATLALKEKDFYYCTNDHPWEHHFEEDNYLPIAPLSEKTFEDIVRKKSFIKLSQKVSLTKWDEADDILLNYFKQLIEMLAA